MEILIHMLAESYFALSVVIFATGPVSNALTTSTYYSSGCDSEDVTPGAASKKIMFWPAWFHIH